MFRLVKYVHIYHLFKNAQSFFSSRVRGHQSRELKVRSCRSHQRTQQYDTKNSRPFILISYHYPAEYIYLCLLALSPQLSANLEQKHISLTLFMYRRCLRFSYTKTNENSAHKQTNQANII